MEYRFCYGPAGAGKSYRLQEEILKKAEETLGRFARMETTGEPGFPSFLYVVPEQYTMQSQKDLVSRAARHGIMNVDVLSFGRLSHRIFEETGADRRAALDDVGKSLILRKAAVLARKDLKVLRTRIDSLGMISEVKSQISEFMQYDISPDGVKELSAYARQKGQGGLAARLDDLEVLYRAFLDDEKDRFLTGEETYDLLAEAIPASHLIKNSVVIFDGFTGFTPVQYRVLTALMENALETIFCLTAGEDAGTPLSQMSGKTSLEEQDLFYLSRKTMRDIIRIGERAGILRGGDIDLSGCQKRYENNPELAHLEKSLFRHPARAWNGTPWKIHLAEASDREEEMRQVFIRIERLVREQGFAYRDIGIVAGDLSVYADIAEQMAATYEVPVYVDQNRAVLLNPLTESVRSVLDLSASGFTYETVFRYLRSGITDLTRQEVDILENYCLEKGIHGIKKWEKKIDDPVLEDLRVRFMREVEPLLLPAGKSHTAKERTQALYRYLLGVHAGEKCASYAAAFEKKGDQIRHLEYDQIYRAVIELLDQIYALLGDEEIGAKEYLKLVETGFSEIRLGVLPQKVDRVFVGDIERSRLSEVKVLFFVGVNDGNIPKGTDKGGLISDLDREFLEGAGAELAPTPRQQMYIQRLYLYLNMTKPTDALYVSFARLAEDGSSLRPSYLVGVLQKLFPKITLEKPERLTAEDQLYTSGDAFLYLSKALREYAMGAYRHEPEKLDAFFTIYGVLYGADKKKTLDLSRAAFRTYSPVPLTKQTALMLYMRTISGSVSRLETAAKCSLRQFLQYGLRLKQRKEYRLGTNDTGNVLHDAVSSFSGELKARGLSWRDFTKEQGDELAGDVLLRSASQYGDKVFYDKERNRYALNRMDRILRRTVHALQFQVQMGEFTPTYFEFPFGENAEFRIALKDGGELDLVGRVDRADLCKKDGKLYVKIVDYKSGDLDLDLKKISKGLQLQLIVYMEAILWMLKDRYPDAAPEPAALFYCRFQDPILSGKDAVFTDTLTSEEDREEAEKKMDLALIKHLRPKGMVSGEEEVIALLDTSLDPTKAGDSIVIPAKRLKGGGLAKATKAFTQESFKALTEQVNTTIRDLAEDILKGDIAANPRVLDSKSTACTWCPYRDSCGFDQRIPGYYFRED